MLIHGWNVPIVANVIAILGECVAIENIPTLIDFLLNRECICWPPFEGLACQRNRCFNVRTQKFFTFGTNDMNHFAGLQQSRDLLAHEGSCCQRWQRLFRSLGCDEDMGLSLRYRISRP